MAVTYYVALPFVRAEDGMAPGQAQEMPNEQAAIRRAEAPQYRGIYTHTQGLLTNELMFVRRSPAANPFSLCNLHDRRQPSVDAE